MKSREARDAMMARVQAAHKKWPKFHDMPTTKKGGPTVGIDEALMAVDPGQAYVKALYAAAYRGEPIGRQGSTILVRKVEEPEI